MRVRDSHVELPMRECGDNDAALNTVMCAVIGFLMARTNSWEELARKVYEIINATAFSTQIGLNGSPDIMAISHQLRDNLDNVRSTSASSARHCRRNGQRVMSLDDASGTEGASHLMDLPTVMRRVGLGRSTIYRMMESKRFPKPADLGVKAVRWASADIEQWIKDVGEKE